MSSSVEKPFPELETPAALVDLDRVAANLDRMAGYAASHHLALRPHIKTHKTPELALEQLRRGAVGVTCATPLEAEVMSDVAGDILVAYPPVDSLRIARLLALPLEVRLTVALDSREALDALSRAAAAAGREVGVLIELDLGMHRVGVARPVDAVQLAADAADARGLEYRGVLFYPGHIRERVEAQDEAIRGLSDELGRYL